MVEEELEREAGGEGFGTVGDGVPVELLGEKGGAGEGVKGMEEEEGESLKEEAVEEGGE